MTALDEDEVEVLPARVTPEIAMAEEDLLNVDKVMSQTQQMRLRIINKLTESARGLPEDVKEQVTLLKAIDGLDKAATTRSRLKIEAEAAKSGAEEARNTAQILRELKGQMFAQSPMGGRREEPVLGSDIPDPILKPGETDIGVSGMTYDAFTKTMDQEENS